MRLIPIFAVVAALVCGSGGAALAEGHVEAPHQSEAETDQEPPTVRLPPQIHANGALCGDPGLTGVPIQPVRGHLTGCGVAQPVQITAVAGVGLSRPVNIDCRTARALRIWVEQAVKPSFSILGGGLAQIEVLSAYSCRPQNGIPGARLSQHGRGRALDISGFTLANGQTVTVLSGWRAPATSAILKAIHAEACGPFGTVLGPDADRHHQDHFHLDTHLRRGGGVCQ